jgi:hypothetical protein
MKKVGSILAVLLAFIILLICISWFNGNYRLSSTGIAVEGTVVELVAQGSTGRTLDYFPVVEFPLENGETKRLKLSISSDAYEVGDPITLLYDAQNTDKVVINNKRGLYLFPSLGILFSVVALGFAISSVKHNFGAKPMDKA